MATAVCGQSCSQGTPPRKGMNRFRPNHDKEALNTVVVMGGLKALGFVCW